MILHGARLSQSEKYWYGRLLKEKPRLPNELRVHRMTRVELLTAPFGFDQEYIFGVFYDSGQESGAKEFIDYPPGSENIIDAIVHLSTTQDVLCFVVRLYNEPCDIGVRRVAEIIRPPRSVSTSWETVGRLIQRKQLRGVFDPKTGRFRRIPKPPLAPILQFTPKRRVI